MPGLTDLGVLHTLVSLLALAAAFAAFLRHGAIGLATATGRAYFWLTALTCLSGFPIMQHGGFGKPHALGVLTLVVLVAAALAARRRVFGAASPYVETVGLSLTVFFHMIPAIAEGGTRLPPGDPWLAHPEAPAALAATGVCFMVFLAGAYWQVRRLRGSRTTAALTPDQL